MARRSPPKRPPAGYLPPIVRPKRPTSRTGGVSSNAMHADFRPSQDRPTLQQKRHPSIPYCPARSSPNPTPRTSRYAGREALSLVEVLAGVAAPGAALWSYGRPGSWDRATAGYGTGSRRTGLTIRPDSPRSPEFESGRSNGTATLLANDSLSYPTTVPYAKASVMSRTVPLVSDGISRHSWRVPAQRSVLSGVVSSRQVFSGSPWDGPSLW
jgi:hypothetical protein